MCLKLGIDDPEQWLEDVPPRVFQLWEAYYAVEPFGYERELMSQMLACLMQLVADGSTSDTVDARIAAIKKIAAQWMPGEWVEQPRRQNSIEMVQRQLEGR